MHAIILHHTYILVLILDILDLSFQHSFILQVFLGGEDDFDIHQPLIVNFVSWAKLAIVDVKFRLA